MSRDKLVLFADEPPRPVPKSKAAFWSPGDGVCGGICSYAAAVADAGVCAMARAAVRGGMEGNL